MSPRVVILVPRREGFPDRDALWAWCRPWWEYRFPDWPVIEGHHDMGLFNRSAAINTAASLAGDWDVAVVIDSDVITHPPNVVEAVRMAHEQGQMTVAFEYRHNLSPGGTHKVMAGFDGSWQTYIARTFGDQHSAVVAIPRRLYDAIGGFDEGFCGWGLEDTAFAMACETFAGKPLLRVWGGEAWHLHHAVQRAEKHGSPSHHRNMARAAQYRAARGDKAAIRMLVEEGRELARSRLQESIPRILHRVVPETTLSVAEQWWEEFRALHPGWRLMTHRDPLDPGQFPITSPLWPRAANGAQLADLVRLEALLNWGGIYVDQDVQPFRSFEPLIGAQAFAAWEDENVIPNAIMGARPDHPAIRECLDLAVKRIGAKHRVNGPGGTWEAGPGVTTQVFKGRDDVLLLPPGSLYDVHYRDPDRDRKMDEPAPPWSFARHHYWGSWLPEERRRVPVAA